MVHKHRASQKATIAKDVSPMRNMSANKYTMSASPSGGFGMNFGSRLSVPGAVPVAVAADKWKYNDMINNNRDQFNNLHFC